MTLETGVKELAEAVGADVKALDAGKVNSTDPRLTDSREWSADTVTQAEAEAGTASIRRAWTAQRVRQAITSWWSKLGSATAVADKVPIADGDGKISTNWLKTDVSTDPLSVTDIVLTRGAYGIGDVGAHDNFPTPTSLMYNSFWGGNCVFINSKGSPYGSVLLLEQNKLSFGSVNNDDGIWAAEVITDKNQVVLGTTSKSARQALELMDEGDGWVDLRPYLLPPFYWDTVRDTRNKFPRIRKNPSGWVELDGVVSWNESPAAPQNGIAFRVPPEFRPAYTSAGVSFVDSTPIYFGTGQWLITGEDEYSSGLHGEMMLILGNPPSPSQGVFGLNGVGWFLD